MGHTSVFAAFATGTVAGDFGRNGRNPGQFHWIHAVAVDAKGDVYAAVMDAGKRVPDVQTYV